MASSETLTFNLKQVVGIVIAALTIGGGIARYESRSDIMERKLDNLAHMISVKDSTTTTKFLAYDKKFNDLEGDIKAVTTSLTAFIRPDDIIIRRRR